MKSKIEEIVIEREVTITMKEGEAKNIRKFIGNTTPGNRKAIMFSMYDDTSLVELFNSLDRLTLRDTE